MDHGRWRLAAGELGVGLNSTGLSQQLSTASVPVRERLPMWREVFGQAMVRLDIEPTRDVPFHAEGTLCA